MRYVFSLVLLLHGAIHLLGAVKGLGLAPVEPLTLPISARMGIAWLVAAVLLMAAAVLFLVLPRWWWLAGLAGLVLSQWLIITSWGDARVGTLANVVLLVPLVIAIAEWLPSSPRSQYERSAAAGFAADTVTAPPLVTEADLVALPAPVSRWLLRAGVVGKPRVRNFRLTFVAQMRGAPDDAWMDATAEQVEFFHPPRRLFLMRASKGGVPMVVLHRYEGDSATMDVKLAGIVRVQRLAGAEATQSETVTLFNDICLLAPGALFDAPVTWTAIDDHSASATYTNAGHTIRAVLWFNAEGDLVNFTSNDRSRAQGATMERLPFSTPITRLGEFAGVRVVADGEARYVEKGRDWAYGRFVLQGIAYNVRGP
jgi:hypothetical protein